MYNALLVGVGGFLGASSRYIINAIIIKMYHNSFPLSTLIVNIIGSFCVGLIMAMPNLQQNHKLFIVTGILGGFTTFSTFSYETMELLAKQQVILGVINIVLSILLCLLGVILGKLLMKSII